MMLEFLKRNSGHIFWVVLFGVPGLVLEPLCKWVLKMMLHYPRLTRVVVTGLLMMGIYLHRTQWMVYVCLGFCFFTCDYFFRTHKE